MHHEMKLYGDSFAKMTKGSKKSELRLNDEKRQLLHVGDTIEFCNTLNQGETVQVEITYLNTYPNFTELFEGVKQDYPSWEKEPFIQGMYQYYSPEDEKKYGALEIGIRLLSKMASDHLTYLAYEGRKLSTTFVETTRVQEGVACDVYEIDAERDLGVVTIQPGFHSPRQRILKGTKTIQRFISGTAQLSVTDVEGNVHVHTFNSKGVTQNNDVEVKVGEIMEWSSLGPQPLVYHEICEPPYEDGRFENLPQ